MRSKVTITYDMDVEVEIEHEPDDDDLEDKACEVVESRLKGLNFDIHDVTINIETM